MAILASSSTYADGVYRDENYAISFRYPENWSERKPQLHSTLVLLYADDGSNATCNVSSKGFEELTSLSTKQLQELRSANHDRKYYIGLSDHFNNGALIRYWRGYLGQIEAGFAEIEYDLFVNDTTSRVRQIVGATLANGRRFTLLCNGTPPGYKSTSDAFEYIRSTLLFMH